jgi:hypothetical protein
MVPKLRKYYLATIFVFLISGCSPKLPYDDATSKNTISPIPRFEIVGGLPTLMGPSVVYEGVWLSELEGSQFFENDLTIRERYGDIYFNTWLTLHVNDPKFPPKSELTKYKSAYGDYAANFVFVRFIGRRNVFPGPLGFGHLGTSKNEIIVEKVIIAKPLQRQI